MYCILYYTQRIFLQFHCSKSTQINASRNCYLVSLSHVSLKDKSLWMYVGSWLSLLVEVERDDVVRGDRHGPVALPAVRIGLRVLRGQDQTPGSRQVPSTRSYGGGPRKKSEYNSMNKRQIYNRHTVQCRHALLSHISVTCRWNLKFNIHFSFRKANHSDLSCAKSTSIGAMDLCQNYVNLEKLC